MRLVPGLDFIIADLHCGIFCETERHHHELCIHRIVVVGDFLAQIKFVGDIGCGEQGEILGIVLL